MDSVCFYVALDGCRDALVRHFKCQGPNVHVLWDVDSFVSRVTVPADAPMETIVSAVEFDRVNGRVDETETPSLYEIFDDNDIMIGWEAEYTILPDDYCCHCQC